MKKWQIALLAGLAALACGCFGLLFGFTVGYGIGRQSPAPAPTDRGMDRVVAAQAIPAGALVTNETPACVGILLEFDGAATNPDFSGAGDAPCCR